MSPKRIIRSLLFPVVIIACGACGNGYQDAGSTAKMDSFVENLQKSGLSAEDFSFKLADAGMNGTSDELVRALPAGLRDDLPSVSDALMLDLAQQTGANTQLDQKPVGQGAAVVAIIANASSDLWVRNVLEWIALNHFNKHMRKNYRTAKVCVGASAKWGCFMDAIESVGATHAKIDLVIESHGNYDATGSYAGDDYNQSKYARDILASQWAPKYRMGFFMLCFSARGEGGFPQTFLRLGGKAAYGSDQLSSAVSDLVIQEQMGTKGKSMGDAVECGNNAPLDWFARQWGNLNPQYQGIGKMTPKIPFGDVSVKIKGK